MPRRDGNVSAEGRRSGRNHRPMHSARKGRQHKPKKLRNAAIRAGRIDEYLHQKKLAENAEWWKRVNGGKARA